MKIPILITMLILAGSISIGISYGIVYNENVQVNNPHNLIIGNTNFTNTLLAVSGNAPPAVGNEIDALGFFPTFTQGANIASLYSTYPIVNTGGTINNLYGMWIRSGALTSGTVTNHYGIYVENPTFGTNQYGIYVAGGQNVLGGNLGIGATPYTNSLLTVAGNAPNPNGGEIDALSFTPTFTKNATVASLYTTYPVVNNVQSIGKINNLYGMWIRSGALTTGTVTNHYGIYVENPTFGTNQFAIYSAGGNNYFGGNVQLNGNLTSTPTNELAITTTNGKDICIGSC